MCVTPQRELADVPPASGLKSITPFEVNQKRRTNYLIGNTNDDACISWYSALRRMNNTMFMIAPARFCVLRMFHTMKSRDALTDSNVRPVDAFLAGFPLNCHRVLVVVVGGDREERGRGKEER